MALNPAVDMAKAQGLSKNLAYTGKVIQNNDAKFHPDKRMLGRVQIRVETIFEGIPDDMLPWAIPEFGSNCDGASATSGSFAVPKIGSKVLVYFQDGSPLHPKYSAYTVDEQTALKEREHHYPNRVVHLFQNSSMVIVDTESNEMYVRDPGNLHIYIQGDCNLQVDGNVNEKINGNKTTHVKGNVVEKVDGNKTLHLGGNYQEVIKGSHEQHVTGTFLEATGGARTIDVGSTSTETVRAARKVIVSGDDTHSASGIVIRTGALIHDNPGGSMSAGAAPSEPAAPTIAKLPFWPVVRGKKPDTASTQPTVTDES